MSQQEGHLSAADYGHHPNEDEEIFDLNARIDQLGSPILGVVVVEFLGA